MAPIATCFILVHICHHTKNFPLRCSVGVVGPYGTSSHLRQPPASFALALLLELRSGWVVCLPQCFTAAQRLNLRVQERILSCAEVHWQPYIVM